MKVNGRAIWEKGIFVGSFFGGQLYFFARRTIFEMIKERGYDVPDSEIDLSLAQFVNIYGSHPNPDDLQISFSLESKKRSKKIWVIFFGRQMVDLSIARDIIAPKIPPKERKNCSGLILMLQNEITDEARSNLDRLRFKVEIFQMTDLVLSMDITKDVAKKKDFVPTGMEKQKLQKKCNLKEKQGKVRAQPSWTYTPTKTPTVRASPTMKTPTFRASPTHGHMTQHVSQSLKRKQPEPESLASQSSTTNVVDETILAEASPTIPAKPISTALNEAATKMKDKEEEVRLPPTKHRCLVECNGTSDTEALPKALTSLSSVNTSSEEAKADASGASSTVTQEPVEEVPASEVEEQVTEKGISKGRDTFTSSSPLTHRPAEPEPSRTVLDSQTLPNTESMEGEYSSPPRAPPRSPLPFLSPIQPLIDRVKEEGIYVEPLQAGPSSTTLDTGASFVAGKGTSRGLSPLNSSSKEMPPNSSMASSLTNLNPASDLDLSQLLGRLQSMKGNFNSLPEGVPHHVAYIKARVKELLGGMRANPSEFQGFDVLVNALTVLPRLVSPNHHSRLMSLKGMVERVRFSVRNSHSKEEPRILSQIEEMCDKAEEAKAKVASIEAERVKAVEVSRVLEAQIGELRAQLHGVEVRLCMLDSDLIHARTCVEELRQEISSKLPRFDEQLSSAKRANADLDRLTFDVSFYAKYALDYSSFLDFV